MSKEIKVYRNELKYFIGQAEYHYLKAIISTVLQRDSYGKLDGDYWIRSLYFDTNLNKDYYEKVIGVKERKKIRLRIYDTETSYAKLEIKNRYDQYMLKETATISKDDALELINGNTEVLLNYNSSITNKVYGLMHLEGYRPSAIIDYEREAYVGDINSIRITFDKNIRGCIESRDLFNKDIATSRIFNEDIIVLEVKYNNMLPKYIRDILGTCRGERSSISKYCLAKIV